MGRASKVIVLAEDQRHRRFVGGYLKRLGYSYHDVRFEAVSNGLGCGEQWVRQRYASAVQAYRSRSARTKTALVVIIDADPGGIKLRRRQLEAGLADAALEPRGADETIVHLIPRRNIETWILCLSGRDVDEETDYSRQDVGSMITGAALTFFNWTRQNFALPKYCIPSLRAAVPESRRLEPANSRQE